jgi:peptidoglycan/xylan/chitin deacetylase (PgdA/CDA1 family)
MDEATFCNQMNYIRKNFVVLPLIDAAQQLQNGTIREPTVALTFDDGFQSIFDTVFPILGKLDLSATVFISTGFVDSDDILWFCKLHGVLAETSRPSLCRFGQRFDLTTPAAKAAASSHLQDRLKRLNHADLMEEVLAIIHELSAYHQEVSTSPQYRILNSHAIRVMRDSGLVEFGAHGVSHAILTRVPERRAREEILQSIEATGELCGRPCRLFAYPNGGPEDYNRDIVRLLKDAGIVAAVTARTGTNVASTSPLELRRYSIGATTSFQHFQVLVHHTVSAVFNV